MTFPYFENPKTGERAVLRHKPTHDGDVTVGDFYAAPGAAVVGEHVHPHSVETFTVVRGVLSVRIDGRDDQLTPGGRMSVPAGTPHDLWNAGDEAAMVVVEVSPGGRFDTMIRNLFFLAADGKTDAKGRPGLLQASLLAQEFADVIRFTTPPAIVQRVVFGALAPIARLRGLRGNNPEYANRVTGYVDELESLPPDLAALLPTGVPGGVTPGERL
jgi:quercetin dioxygenase-like cupin family protein